MQGPQNDIASEFYEIFKREIISYLPNPFLKIKDRIFISSFQETNIILIPKPYETIFDLNVNFPQRHVLRAEAMFRTGA